MKHVQLRRKVVHAGRRVTEAEARHSIEAVESLIAHLRAASK
jgi:hypothetical protein